MKIPERDVRDQAAGPKSACPSLLSAMFPATNCKRISPTAIRRRHHAQDQTCCIHHCRVLALSSTDCVVVGFVSGSDLLGSCAPSRTDPVYRLKVAECGGYVIGVADIFDCKNQLLGFSWRSNMEASQRELVDVVIRWISHHPDIPSYEADGLVAAALSERFPCHWLS